MNSLPVPTYSWISKIGFIVSFLFITLAFTALYLYHETSPEKIFRENYRPYERRILRGASETSALNEAYSDGNMDSVLMAFSAMKSPVPEEYLMAGIAFLEKNQPRKAIETLKTMLQKNQDSKSDLFEEDAEYYLAMSYLGNQEPEKAMPIFEKIEADPEHPYNSNVSEWFLLNVRTSIAKK